jgi:hypothetical protein
MWFKCQEITAAGLVARDPLEHFFSPGAVKFDPALRVQFPVVLYGCGGTSGNELLYLAAATLLLAPRCILEIGTFTGLTTVLFILNAPLARVLTLDLPPEAVPSSEYIASDISLVEGRKTGHYQRVFGLPESCQQILCDSMSFDPKPLANTVDLGFIDGSHALRYVVNDTEKMSQMITDHGIVFWHDYGGVGDFRELSEYLESLAANAPIYRIGDAILAWAMGRDLKAALLRS